MFLICLIPFLCCAQANDLEPIQPKGRTVMSKWYGVLDYALHNPIKTLGAIALICTIPSVEANDCKKAAKDLWGEFTFSSWDRNANMAVYNETSTGDGNGYINIFRYMRDVNCEVFQNPEAVSWDTTPFALCCTIFPYIDPTPSLMNQYGTVAFDWPYLKTTNSSEIPVPLPSQTDYSRIECFTFFPNRWTLSILSDNQTFFSWCQSYPALKSSEKRKKS